MGDVESDHRHVDPALEDAAGCLGVGPDVELGRGSAVSLAHRAAHQHDPLGARVRLEGEQQRDVRQRADRDERDLPLPLPDLLGEERHGVLLDRRARGRRQLRAVEPGLAVHVRRDVLLSYEGCGGAARHGHVAAADELEQAQGVRRCLLDRLVARDSGDADKVELRRCEREQQGDRVVVTRVAVEDDRRRTHIFSQSSTIAVCGSELWAPSVAAA